MGRGRAAGRAGSLSRHGWSGHGLAAPKAATAGTGWQPLSGHGLADRITLFAINSGAMANGRASLPPWPTCTCTEASCACTGVHSANTSPVPHQYLTSTSPVPHHYLANTSPIPREYLTTTSPLPHQYLTSTSRVPHQYLANTSPLLHEYLTGTSPLPHQYLTNTSPTLHQYLTNTSPIPRQ